MLYNTSLCSGPLCSLFATAGDSDFEPQTVNIEELSYRQQQGRSIKKLSCKRLPWDTSKVCSIPIEVRKAFKSLSVDMNYHLRTPLDGYKNKFDISLYQWSSSWLDVKITPTDLVYDDTFSKQKLISPAGASLDEMRERSDASLLLTIGSNTSFTMLLSVELRFRFADVHKTRNEESVYWRNKYHITKKEHAPIILTLSGEMHFVNISSNTTVMAWVVYQWLFDTTKPKVSPLCTKSAKLSRNLRRKRSRPRFDITIGSRFGTYHFLKTCHCGSCLPCPRNNYTWNKAYNICKRKGLELPQLFSRNEQRELQRIIQLSDCLYFIEAVFLALTKTTSG